MRRAIATVDELAAALLFAGAFVRLGVRTRGTPGAALTPIPRSVHGA